MNNFNVNNTGINVLHLNQCGIIENFLNLLIDTQFKNNFINFMFN